MLLEFPTEITIAILNGCCLKPNDSGHASQGITRQHVSLIEALQIPSGI